MIRQLVDVSDSDYALTLVWEWADVTLHELMREPAVADDDKVGVVANVRAALDILHALDLVHCDVAPNNVFRVRGTWKLGDLDSVRERGAPLDRFPLEHYRHPDALPGAPADPLFDFYSLDRIAERLRS